MHYKGTKIIAAHSFLEKMQAIIKNSGATSLKKGKKNVKLESHSKSNFHKKWLKIFYKS